MDIPASGAATSAAYDISVQRKMLDQQRQDGANAVKLIEAANAQPTQAPAGGDSTIHVIA